MDQALDWCEAAGLRTIVDLHILRSHYFIATSEPPLFTDPKEEAKFGDLWVQLSKRLERRSVDRVAYELMNEAVATNPEDWNRVAHAAFGAIRRRARGKLVQRVVSFLLSSPASPGRAYCASSTGVTAAQSATHSSQTP